MVTVLAVLVLSNGPNKSQNFSSNQQKLILTNPLVKLTKTLVEKQPI